MLKGNIFCSNWRKFELTNVYCIYILYHISFLWYTISLPIWSEQKEQYLSSSVCWSNFDVCVFLLVVDDKKLVCKQRGYFSTNSWNYASMTWQDLNLWPKDWTHVYQKNIHYGELHYGKHNCKEHHYEEHHYGEHIVFYFVPYFLVKENYYWIAIKVYSRFPRWNLISRASCFFDLPYLFMFFRLFVLLLQRHINESTNIYILVWDPCNKNSIYLKMAGKKYLCFCAAI